MSSAAHLLPAPAARAARNFVLTFGSVGDTVNLAQGLLDSRDPEAAIVKGAVTGSLTALGIVRDEHRRDRQHLVGAPCSLACWPPTISSASFAS